jgi:hypothetical protein
VRRPSAATVIASVALFVALAGSGVAAVRLVVPKNSVGTKQLREGAVDSAKVKNHSLLGADFKKGQLHAGPRGAMGPGIDTWVIAKANGTIDKSSKVKAVTSAGVGIYKVTFTVSVAACSLVASAGNESAGSVTRGIVADFNRTSDPATIEVATSKGTTAAAHAFSLAAVCPATTSTTQTSTTGTTTTTTTSTTTTGS